MKEQVLYVENLKCGGCESTVHKILEGIKGLSNVSVSADEGKISYESVDDQKIREQVVTFLTKAGYTPLGESDLRAKAMSYVSCMRGKISN